MSDPINPNFKKGVGRLVTDRYDFQDHVDGYRFRHNASAITLSPTVTIDGYGPQNNVQSAIEKLALVVNPPTILINDATLFAKGIIQLAGDLGGTATNVKVVKIQGFNVVTTAPTSGQTLTWNGSAWAPATPSSTFIASQDLFGNNVSQTVVGIQTRAVANTAPSNRQTLTWISGNNRWEPTTTQPTGTGFTHNTSGVVDSAATANIRYTGGKFQTSANIQYLNSSITGDLAWAPTSSNKTLTLPDITDVIVTRTNTETLTNKTINATNNTITDTGTVSGDILVSNGTKFVRQAKGANGSFLGVQAGVVGYYTPSSSTPTGTGFAHVTSGTYDSAATANIRYAGGKFQTDVAMQFQNGGITGDLAWGPTISNKTLLLPDASDTLVGKATTDNFTNKTFNVAGTGNFLTSTSQATGDLLKNNGTQFLRFARGTALQVLRVNAGGTDLEWATIATGGSSSGASGVIQLSDGAGGFTGFTDLSGGSGFISLSASAASVGHIRFPYNASLVSLLATKNSVNVDSAVISQQGQNLYFGNIAPVATTMSSTLRGLDITVDPVQQFRVSTFNGGAGNYALVVDDSGSSTKINVPFGSGNYATIETRLAFGNAGPKITFFGGVTGVASGKRNYIEIANSAIIPTGTPTGGGYLFVDAGALKYTGSSGTTTTVAPAEPHCKKCGRDFMHEWQNDNYGKLSTCMPCLLDALEVLGIDVNAFSDRNLNP